MTLQLPARIPLPMPPGEGNGLIDLAGDIANAVRRLSEVDERLLGPAAAAPGWLGADATAAAAQVGTASTRIRAAADAMPPAAQRLAAHGELLLETRRRVSALRDEQTRQFTDADRRWGNFSDPQMQSLIGAPQARAIVAELEACEASRRRRHSALLEEVEDDAAATVRVLVESCAAVGGMGRPGDANRVVAYLAAQLPGWGDRELTRRGFALATRLTAGTPETKARAASAAAPFASSRAFANALLASLGVGGLTSVLTDLGHNLFGPDSAVARVLGRAFGAAVPGAGSGDRVASVLDAEYVHPRDGFALAGAVATGLAMLLSAGRSTPSDGVGTQTVARWGRQFLRWEHENHDTIGTRSTNWAPEVGDPTGLAISVLAERADRSVSAALLDDPEIWRAALRRVYDDGGAALSDVIAQAGRESGARGDRVVLLGLATAGAGLEGGDPSAWTVNRDTLAGVAPGMGDAVSAHIDVAVGALQVGVDGHLQRSQPQVLAGLGLVTLDRGAAAAVEKALEGWAQVQPHDLTATSTAAPLPAIAVPSAYVAVQQYGQRFAYALDEFEAQAAADWRKRTWKAATLPLVLISGPAGIAAGIAAGYLAIPLHMDGSWDAEPDRGLVFDAGDAAHAASGGAGASATSPDDEAVVAAQAQVAYQRASVALGIPTPPVSADADFTAPLDDAVRGLMWGRITRGHEVTERIGSTVDHLIG